MMKEFYPKKCPCKNTFRNTRPMTDAAGIKERNVSAQIHLQMVKRSHSSRTILKTLFLSVTVTVLFTGDTQFHLDSAIVEEPCLALELDE